MLSDSPASSSPHSQFSDPRSPSRSSSLASLPPAVLPRRSSSPFRDMLSDHPVPSRPYVPRSSSRSSSLAPLSPIVLPLRSSIQFSTTSHTPAPEITLNPFPPTHRDARTIHKYQPAPVALGILKSLDRDEGQHISHSRAVHELSEDSLIIDDRDKAEKKENKKFFLDGIIRDRDTDKDRDRGRDKDRKDRKNRERNKRREMDKGREKDKEQAREHHWREEDNPEELTRVIGHLTATSSDDWALILEACKRACASEANAREATKALRREFKYAEPEAQLSAARLWAVMLGNASDVFLTQISSRKFISALEDVLTNSRTKPVVRERLMEVLAAAAFITSSRLHPKDRIRVLWTCLKPADKPDVGIPFDPEDAALIPLILPVHPPMEEHSAALIPNALLASGGGDAMLPTPPAEGRSYEGPNSSSAHAIHDVSTTSTESKLAEERDRVDDNDKDSVGDIELLHVRFPQVESDSHSLVPPGEMLQDLTTLITKIRDQPMSQ
ncbi:hypothetical protein K503DRAFT_430395 [Rhizopogon vinicolor AM-OR11-026]|uniref:VHS domain-containing protein n=1 Tax=Rhizopogon vinicolor AM-OR11-026 TaxID=1314800 RepID=A0A1B7MPU3_9AGAM|nr:hypothetical protein K503DRAFT_430395 [Rhizopogon vinicolor AM-OR11-026]